MIKKCKKNINNKNVEFQCDDALQMFAESFFDLLEKEEAEYSIIKDNYTIQIGWSFYFINKGEDDTFIISSPDYDKNPFEDKSENLTKSFYIQMMQNELLHKTGCMGSPATFQDTIVVLKDAMEFKDVYMHRTSESKDGDCGWYIGLLDDPKDEHPVEDYTRIYTYELLKYNPELLKVLTLDVGCIAIFKDGKLVEIADKDDNKIF